MTSFIKAALVFCMIALGASSAIAGEPEWVDIANTKEGITFQIKKHSFKSGTDEKGNPSGSVLWQAVNQTGKRTPGQWRVTAADCASGKGKLVHLDDKGSFVAADDFDINGNSVETAAAIAVCSAIEGDGQALKVRDIPTLGADQEWSDLFKKADTTQKWSYRKGTQSLGENKAGEAVIAVQMRQFDNKENRATFTGWWYIRAKDCAAGKGQIVVSHRSGEFFDEMDFDITNDSGPFVQTSFARNICDILKRAILDHAQENPVSP